MSFPLFSPCGPCSPGRAYWEARDSRIESVLSPPAYYYPCSPAYPCSPSSPGRAYWEARNSRSGSVPSPTYPCSPAHYPYYPCSPTDLDFDALEKVNEALASEMKEVAAEQQRLEESIQALTAEEQAFREQQHYFQPFTWTQAEAEATAEAEERATQALLQLATSN